MLPHPCRQADVRAIQLIHRQAMARSDRSRRWPVPGLVPESSGFVLHLSSAAEGEKPVGKPSESSWHLLSALSSAPAGAVGGRVASDVDGNVANRPDRGTHQLGLGLRCELMVQSPKHTLDRTRVVVLGKQHRFAFVEFALIPAFEEPATVIAVGQGVIEGPCGVPDPVGCSSCMAHLRASTGA